MQPQTLPFMSDQTARLPAEVSNTVAELQRQLKSSSEKKQQALIQELANTGTAGLDVLDR
ncbi:MAG: hypothetical protein F6K50_43345, partial [Moorea sp. SIO3I7]|nr:hypothetical protein [Moorena sp. SIO3I7]